MIGNPNKTKICLNLAKSLCGDTKKFDEIENEVCKIKASPSKEKFQGKTQNNRRY